MALLVPKALVDEARATARAALDRAFSGAFGLIQSAVDRRQSAAHAHERALYHAEMARLLPGIALAAKASRVRRHRRLAMRWGARAYARDPVLAAVCAIESPHLGGHA